MPGEPIPTRAELDSAIGVTIEGPAASFALSADHGGAVKKALSDTAFYQEFKERVKQCVDDRLGHDYEVASVNFADDSGTPGNAYILIEISGSETVDPAPLVSRAGRTFAQRCSAALERCRRAAAEMLKERLGEDVRVMSAWEPSTGVTIRRSYSGPNASLEDIIGRLAELRANGSRISMIRLATLAGVALALTVGLIILLASHNVVAMAGAAAYIGIPALVLNRMSSARLRDIATEKRELEDALELRDTEDERERRALKLVQANAFALGRYYDQGLQQRSMVFALGFICVLVGFATIGAAFIVIGTAHDQATSTTIVVGALGAVGTLLANYVAVIFLRMFSETITATTEFHTRLVGTQHVNLGYLAAAKIASASIRDATLSQMAIELAGNAVTPPTKSPTG